MRTSLLPLALVAVFAAPLPALAAGKAQQITIPDFTQGGTIPAGAKHDWNLGPTGLRGWMFCDKMVTTDARQIAITKVEKGSPADGILVVGDVILGVGGKPFSYDPRTEFGKALTTAEAEAGGGRLTVTRWRAGKSEDVALKLPVLGTYSATAPYDCPKSKRILEQGCRALAEGVAKSSHEADPIPELKRIADYFEKDEKDFPKELMLLKAKCVRETIRAIEASTDSPALIRIK